MASKAEDLVDAIVARLAAGTFTVPVTVSKALVPVYDRADLTGVKVDVFSGGRTWEKQSRGGLWMNGYVIGLVIRKPAKPTNTDIGQLLLLTEQLFDWLKDQSFSGVVLQEGEQDEPYKMEALLDEGKGFVELRLIYKGF